MQGIIPKCLEELVQERFGDEQWKRILEKSGLSPATTFGSAAQVPDEVVAAVVRNACDVLRLTPVQVADTFKDYWLTVFAPRLYKERLLSPKVSRITQSDGTFMMH